MYVDYSAWNNLSMLLYLVPMSKLDEMYAILTGPTIYTLLDCTLSYHHMALSPVSSE